MTDLSINRIKWFSTALILSGILLTNLNAYPINIIIHGTGAVGWSIVGYMTKDRALLNKLWFTTSTIYFWIYLFAFMKNKNILFMCVANSARSQMAEGIAKKLYPN